MIHNLCFLLCLHHLNFHKTHHLLPLTASSLTLNPLWLPHSWRWGNSMRKYVPCFASSPSLDLSCTLCSLFPQRLYQAASYRVLLHSSLQEKRELKDTFLPLLPSCHSSNITVSEMTRFSLHPPPSLSLSCHFVGVGIIYCKVQRLREWAGAEGL